MKVTRKTAVSLMTFVILGVLHMRRVTMEARYKRLRILAGVVVYLSIAQSVPAQLYYSTLVGTVRDTTGAVVPHAQVTVTDVSTGVKTSAATDGAGNFLIETL